MVSLGPSLGTKSTDSGISDILVLVNIPGFNRLYMTSVVGVTMLGVDIV